MNNETHETHEDRVKILECAPDDTATHIDADGDYIKYGNYDVWCYIRHLKKWICYGSISTSTRSLSDIQQLVDMQNEIDEFKRCLRSVDSKLSYALYDEDGTLDNIRKSLLIIHEVSNE